MNYHKIKKAEYQDFSPIAVAFFIEIEGFAFTDEYHTAQKKNPAYPVKVDIWEPGFIKSWHKEFNS